MEGIHTVGLGDDIHGKMNVSNNPMIRNVSSPHLSSLQMYSGTTSFLEPTSAKEHEIRVMLVDNDKESLLSTARMLDLNSCQVTMVVSGSIAMKTISAGKKKFDMVIIDAELSDLDGFQLCKEIEKMGILVVVISTKEDPELTYKALDNGAFLFMKKPIDELSTKYLHQIVVKKRIQSSKKNMGVEMIAMENFLPNGILFTESTDEDAMWKKRTYKRKNGTKEGDNDHPAQVSLLCDQQNLNVEIFSVDKFNKKKMCIEWTKELHQKFMDAIAQLGEGNCYPKEILELMNVPGLTRMHVASHLQKCRHAKWRSPLERKNQYQKRKFSTPGTSAKKENEKIKVFGCMPHLDYESQAKVQKNHHLVSVSSFGNMPTEKFQTSDSRNGTLQNFNIPTANFSEKENGPARWMEHVDLIEGESPKWTAQGVQLLNPTSHPWAFPLPTFNIVPSVTINNNATTTCYGPIHVACDDPTKEAINANINLMPPSEISDVLTGELFTEFEEMNFLPPEFPSFSLDNKFENYDNHIGDEVHHPRWA